MRNLSAVLEIESRAAGTGVTHRLECLTVVFVVCDGVRKDV